MIEVTLRFNTLDELNNWVLGEAVRLQAQQEYDRLDEVMRMQFDELSARNPKGAAEILDEIDEPDAEGFARRSLETRRRYLNELLTKTYPYSPPARAGGAELRSFLEKERQE